MLSQCLVFARAVKPTVFALLCTNTTFSFSVNFFNVSALGNLKTNNAVHASLMSLS